MNICVDICDDFVLYSYIIVIGYDCEYGYGSIIRLWVENLVVCILWGNVGIVYERVVDRFRYYYRNVVDIKIEEMY